jgi:cytidyltransferase-like protein
MRPAIESLLATFNAVLDSGEINEEVQALGLDKNPNLFFNTEFVDEKVDEAGGRSPINVVLYNENFFAVHGMSEFYTKISPKRGSKSRGSREVLLDEEKLVALQNLVQKTRKFSENFNIYGPEDTKAELVTNIDFGNALGQEVTIFLSPDKPITDTLGGWLNNSETVNPFQASVTLIDGKKVGALSKFIYVNVLPDGRSGIPLSELSQDSFEDRVAAINGALFNHGTRLMGKEVLKAMNTVFGDSNVSNHEGIVLRDEELFGYGGPVKITGDFIVTGMAGTISNLMKIEEPASEERMMSIGLVPMAAKPFHVGHMTLIELASQQNDQVKVYVSLSDRAKPGEFPIYGEQMQRIWQEHLLNIMPENVDVDLLPVGMQPVRMVYETLSNASDTNSANIWRIYSDPVDTNQNYKEAYRQKYFGDAYNNGQVIFAAEENPEQFTRGAGTPDASGTMARDYLNNNDFESFVKMMPAGVDVQAIWDILTGNIEPEAPEEETQGAPPIFMGESTLNFMFEVIKEQLLINEQTEPFQLKVKAQHPGDKQDLVGYGGIGIDKGNKKPSMKRSKSAPPIGEQQEELEEMSSMAAGNVQGYSGGKKKKQPSLIREEDDELVEEAMYYLLKALL